MAVDVQDLILKKVDALDVKLEALQKTSIAQTTLLEAVKKQYGIVQEAIVGTKRDFEQFKESAFSSLSKKVDSLEVSIKPILKAFVDKEDDKKDVRKWILRATVLLFFGLGSGFIIEHIKAILHYLY